MYTREKISKSDRGTSKRLSAYMFVDQRVDYGSERPLLAFIFQVLQFNMARNFCYLGGGILTNRSCLTDMNAWLYAQPGGRYRMLGL